MDNKVYLEVELKCTVQGEIIPTAIIWQDGRRFEIDKILDVKRRASLKAGGVGIRYECMIEGSIKYLFMEDIEFNRLSGAKWFVELP